MKRQVLRILLFAHPRSGSNSLTAVLNQHPQINLMTEPFNEEREKWAEDEKNYKNETNSIKDLDRVLDEIHKSYNGFKTLSYQLPKKLTEYLLTKKGYRIFFLHRKNLLRSMISAFIAEQTHIWTAEEKLTKQKQPQKLEPLNITKLKKEIKYLKEDTEHYLNVLQKSQIPFLKIAYEELFEVSDSKKYKKLQQIFDFLSLNIPKNKEKKMMSLMSPKRRITGTEIYNLVPNIHKVEEKLGSDVTGFLFK